MKGLYLLFFFFSSSFLMGQNAFVIGNVQVNNMLDKSTFPTTIDFQFSTRLSLGAQLPLYYDTLKQKEKVSLELGIGTLLNSLYYKNSYQKNPRNDGNINDVFGLFLKVEPSFNIWQNKKRTLFLHGSLNNVFYIFDSYSAETSFINRDSNDVVLSTTNAKYKYQYALESYLSLSYLLKTKKGAGYLFRLKSGYLFHNLPIAKMSLSNNNEVKSIKLNKFIWTFSIGFLISTNK